jgi:hypothetical protein
MRMGEPSYADIAVALREQMRFEVNALTPLAVLGIKIGLEKDTCDRMVADAQRHADLLAAAWDFFKRNADRELEFRALENRLTSPVQPPANSNERIFARVFRRLFG